MCSNARNEHALQEQGAGQSKSDNSNDDSTATTSRTKALIVGAACWGLLPVKAADWLIRRLHLGAA